MNANVTSLKVDWLRILKSLLNFDIDDNFEVYIGNLELLQAAMIYLDSADARTFANFMNDELLLTFRRVFSLYSLSDNEINKWGNTRAQQRFEQCLGVVREQMPIAFTSLLIRRYTNLAMIESAYEVANRTIDLIASHVENDKTLTDKHREFMSAKLRSVKLILGYPTEILEEGSVEEYYENLNLTGNENFMTLMAENLIFFKNDKFKNLLETDKKELRRNESTRWTDYTKENELEQPPYSFDTNIICKISILILTCRLASKFLFKIFLHFGFNILTLTAIDRDTTRTRCSPFSYRRR